MHRAEKKLRYGASPPSLAARAVGEKRPARTLLAAVSSLFIGVCMANDSRADSSPSPASFASSQGELGVSLLKAAPTSANSVVGPYSIHAALMLARAGALGEAAAELDRVLGTAPYSPQALAAYSTFNESVLAGSTGASVQLASSVWVTSRAQFKPPYISAVSGPLKASAHTIDFSRPEEARTTINGWVSSHTAEKIPQLLPAGMLSADTVAALVSAMHFKAAWQAPFSEDNTARAPFSTAPGETKDVQMMQQMGRYRYYEDSAWKGVALPYAGGEYSFVVLVPKEILTPKGVVSALSAPLIAAAASAQGPVMVTVELPRFTVRESQELSRPLESLGLSAVFSPRGDFSEIATLPVRISAVQHEAFVQVDEHGTEAAAATAVVLAKGIAPFGADEMKEVRADRPFAFAIVHRESGAPLFIGAIGSPE